MEDPITGRKLKIATTHLLVGQKKEEEKKKEDRLGYGLGWAGACTNPEWFISPLSGTFYSLCRLLRRITFK